MKKEMFFCMIWLNACSKEELQQCKKQSSQYSQGLKTCKQLTAQQKKELGKLADSLRKAKSEMATLGEKNKTLQAELTKLKQSPQYHYEQAIKAMAAAKDSKSEQKVIVQFKALGSRFPNSLIVPHAQKKIQELEKKISDRQAALDTAQQSLRSLIKQCKSLTKQSAAIEERGLVFNRNNQLNMNVAMKASRKARKVRNQAEAAKEKGKLLLKTTPDPDGKLKDELLTCDHAE